MGLLSLAGAGLALIFIGTQQSLTSSNNPTNNPSNKESLSLFSTSALSLFFILNSLYTIFNASSPLASALQLQVLPIASLFLAYSFLALLKLHTKTLSFHFPSSFLNLITLFAFIEEFLIFYMHKKDPAGIENRYYDLMLVPIGICIIATVLEIFRNGTGSLRVARGVGVVLQGMWFVQMGFSFFTTWVADGCFVDVRGRGDYTVRCKGDAAYHRGRGVAGIQFNCHLAVLVVFVVGTYAMVAKRDGIGGRDGEYCAVGGEFALGSDEDEIEVVESGMETKGGVVEMGANGFGSH